MLYFSKLKITLIALFTLFMVMVSSSNFLDLDLYTEVINWEEMKDLQRSFLLSQIADQDLPQDYAFFSSLYQFAKKYKIKTIALTTDTPVPNFRTVFKSIIPLFIFL